MIQVVILAGGLATRLRPMTNEIPKSLIPILGRPFIDWQLELLSNSGFEKILLCLGKMSDLIVDHVGDGSKYGLQVSYSFDGDKQLGTGGALVNGITKIEDSFAIMYGDSYLPIDYSSVVEKFANKDCPALMTIYRNSNNFDQSNVEYIDRELVRYSKKVQSPKMKYVDYGFTLLEKRLISGSRFGKEFDLSDLFSQLVSEKKMCGYEVRDRFYEIGSFQGISDLETYLKEGAK